MYFIIGFQMHKQLRLYHTIKYLKIKQIYYRIFYNLRDRYREKTSFQYAYFKNKNIYLLKFTKNIINNTSYKENSFKFLNLSKSFKDEIDWNYNAYGKLWTYNLNYFEFLHQAEIKKHEGLKLIHDFIEKENIIIDGMEPFPISLRGINWIKFLSIHAIEEEKINNFLYRDYIKLMDKIEYHLLGNHLLENGFSLLFAAYFFQDENFYKKSSEILKSELTEQILNDGAHFELSPMYHQLMIYRILDAINLLKNNHWKEEELLNFLIVKAEAMLQWLQLIGYNNGDIPLLNDSANHIAPKSNEIFQYAKRLHISLSSQTKSLQLKDSGYRKIENDSYECIIDIGDIGPQYIPGHAHADTFNFELRIEQQPFIVDSGLSTYENNEIRFYQRGSSAHNTVTIHERNNSEVWSAFRVAHRAKIIHLKEKEKSIEATHNGYQKQFNILHTRKWSFDKKKISIHDTLSHSTKAKAFIHFHPNITKETIEKHIELKNYYRLKKYNFASQYNQLNPAFVLEIPFKQNLHVEIKL